MDKKGLIGYVVIFVIFVAAGYMIYSQANSFSVSGPATITPKVEDKNSSENMVGNDKDEHGCIGSAGYTWCEVKGKCIRSWEEKCESGNAASSDGTTVYTNDKYGFQLALAKGWENYKMLEYNNVPNVASVHVLLPTKDEKWTGVWDANQEKTVSGYADMFAVVIEDLNSWKNKCADQCAKEDSPDCANCDRYVAKNDKYVYSIGNPQAMAEDLIDLREATAENVQKSFKLIGQ